MGPKILKMPRSCEDKGETIPIRTKTGTLDGFVFSGGQFCAYEGYFTMYYFVGLIR